MVRAGTGSNTTRFDMTARETGAFARDLAPQRRQIRLDAVG